MLERAARLRPEPGTNVITYGTNRLDGNTANGAPTGVIPQQ